MNLFGLGLSAMNAAQHNLQTTGHNINNAAVEGYSRQTVLTQTNGAKATGAGYIGRGIQAVTVQRSYDNFLHNQLVKSQSVGASLLTYGTEIAQLNNLFADRSSGVSPAIQKFFDSLQAVASSPADPAARQELIGRADSLATQMNEANRFIDSQRDNINTQLSTVVSQVNSYVERIHNMNEQITKARASGVGNHEPNDLLDQRDQLVSELNQLVDVKVLEQDGNFGLTLGSGQVLLSGPTVYPLHATPSASDPSRYVVSYTSSFKDGVPNKAELADTSFKGGKLGGLLQYRTDTLDGAQNALGRLAIGIAAEINAVHSNGVDLNGDKGEAFFDFSLGKPLAAKNNAGGASVSLSLEDVSKLSVHDYELRIVEIEDPNNTGATVKAVEIRSLPNGDFKALPADGMVDGLKIEVTDLQNAEVGDKWQLQPTRNAADSFSVVITDPAKIAAAGDGLGTADASNALELAKLQNKKTLGQGSMSFNEAFSQLVNRVAVNAEQNATAAGAQKNLIQQNYSAQQAVSGVNLNEEYVMLDRYMDQFRAASRLIEVGSTLFDTLLGLRN